MPLNQTNSTREIEDWDRFAKACHSFDKSQLYLFIVGPTAIGDAILWQYLARLPLSLVLDFDPATEVGGVYSHVINDLRTKRSVHLLTLMDRYTLVPDKACYWYAARGLEGRLGSLIDGDWRAWNRKYGSSLQELIDQFVRSSDGRPLTVVCLWYAPEYIRTVCSAVDRAFGGRASYVFGIPEAHRLDELSSQFDGTSVSIQTANVLYGISKNVKPHQTQTTLDAGIPHKDETYRILSPEDLQWLSEDLEVIHSNVELIPSNEHPTENNFLRGSTISWAELNSRSDADRDKTKQIIKQVKDDLDGRSTARLNLFHWPGAGGTTVARRVAWELRTQYPTVLIKRVTLAETIGRIRMLFQISQLPVFAVVEGADAIPDKLEQLYTEIRAEQIPVVFLSVLRRFDVPNSDKPAERSTYLGPTLNLSESSRFADVYKRATPEKAAQLDAILQSDNPKDRTPFLFALTAFGKNFAGIQRYVQSRLDIATKSQRSIMTFLAMAYYFGHRSLVSQIFAIHLGLPEGIPLRLESTLSDPQLELLVEDDNLRWRPIHQIVAEEILVSELAGTIADRRNWKLSLSNWAVKFISFCRDASFYPSDDTIDLLRRMLILRDEHDLLGTEDAATSHFSRLIDDIPTNEGKLTVLKELAENFPEQAHFWAHLGRFYSYVMGEPSEALAAIARAIEIAPDDPVLFHIEGMCYRRTAYSDISEFLRTPPTLEQINAWRQTVEAAKNSFAEARIIDAAKEHAYISPAQLLLRVLDYGFMASGKQTHTEFLTSPTASWYRDQLDEAENLIERVRGLREGDKDSQYVLSCQAKLDQLYDDYSRALEGWNNLLEREDVFAPPVRRQIVRAYLTRGKREWSSLRPSEIERIVTLMEDNMGEEPSSDYNIRLWFRAYRYLKRQDIDKALDKLAVWRTLGDSPEAYYYLYVLHALKAIDGSVIERTHAKEFIQQSSAKSRNLRNRTRSFEWLGKGNGLQRLKVSVGHLPHFLASPIHG